MCLFVVFDACFVVLLIRAMMGSSWGDLARAFPAREPARDAVRRNFQTVSLNSMNFGGCVHLAVDPTFLHIIPTRFVRVLGGSTGISIPWESIVVSGGDEQRKMRRAQVGSKTLRAPAWCLELADGGAALPRADTPARPSV
ncbi:MAG: hypothetical protein JNM07_10745 [Phycisphaerae bacterium]|nr:hypothetical protein [Phycisphaerae bacterium]